ncbi:MAG: TonB family protein [Thermodesulfobacteriota bacterium]
MSASAETRPGRFGWYDDDDGGRSWLGASLSSLVIYALIAVAVVLLGRATTQVVAPEKEVEVTFVEKVVKPPPPPPPAAPPPKPVPAEVKPPAASAPVVRPEQKVRKLDEPPPVKPLTAPKAMPKAPPKEADPSEDKGVAVHGEPGAGDPAGLEGGVTQGGVAGGTVGGAIALPEDAVPPSPLASNTVPAYPAEARAGGKTGTVVLKVVVLADGSVGDVEVMRGDEPFVSAAVAAVKTWKYEPARHQGQPITVYRIVRIPFKLTV